MAKKWTDALDKLLEGDGKSRSVSEYLKTITSTPESSSSSNDTEKKINNILVMEIDVKNIIRWKYKDRPEDELGDIKELAETFKSVGQQQPCILRPSKEYHGKYEIIVGERRWHAAKLAGMKLKSIIQDIDDRTAALIQAIENEKRSDISEFSKGMSYADKIEKGLITQKDIIDILGISKQQVSRLLSYKKIPKPLFDAIGDFKKISSRTAEEICRLSYKDDKHLNILIELAPKIQTGKCGHNSINKEIKRKLENNLNKIESNKKILSKDGRHLFTWRLDNNAIPSIHFPKDIIKLLNEDVINFDEITREFKECLAKKLFDLKN